MQFENISITTPPPHLLRRQLLNWDLKIQTETNLGESESSQAEGTEIVGMLQGRAELAVFTGGKDAPRTEEAGM